VRGSKHDDPGLVDRVPLKNIERVHGRDAKIVGFVRQCKGGYFACKPLGRGGVSCFGNRNKFRVVVSCLKRLR
jgi:deferrochelatase/peroxidase EfeB